MPTNHITRINIDIDDRSVPLIARVNRRAKRLILKVDPVAGEIHATAPSKRAVADAIAFAQDRKKWIASQLDDDLRARPFSEGVRTPFRGVYHLILRNPALRAPVRCEPGEPPIIRVGGDPAHLNRRLVDWMKREARTRLSERVDGYCERLGAKRRTLCVRDTRSRWGSCTSDGALSFSWRLIMAPPEILDYVAAHECVHLIHMNHSPAFWRQVKALGPDPRMAENWFNENGAKLFSYGVMPSSAH